MIDLLYVIIGIGFVLSLFVQMWLRRTYAQWSRIPNSLNLPGGEVSRYLLDQNGMPMDYGTQVDPDYAGSPFVFTGALDRVVITLTDE